MDLNKLYFDHQLLLIKACQSGNAQVRSAHRTAAQAIADRIAAFQRSLGAANAAAWETLSPPPCECAA